MHCTLQRELAQTLVNARIKSRGEQDANLKFLEAAGNIMRKEPGERSEFHRNFLLWFHETADNRNEQMLTFDVEIERIERAFYFNGFSYLLDD